MDSDLSLEFLRVVEQAAIACAHTMGQGDRHKSDQVAVEAMRKVMDTVPIDGTIVIGEGERDEAPMLYIGEKVGLVHAKNLSGLRHVRFDEVDIAVDPLEGTNLCATGAPNAIAVLAASNKGGLLHAPDLYMEKLVVGPSSKDSVSLDAPVHENLKAIASCLGRHVEDLVVIVLDRERHEKLIADIRATGARIRLIGDGDLSAGIAAAVVGSGVHAVMGTGGAPEGVLTAAAMRCLNGEIFARLVVSKPEHEERCRAMGITDFKKVYRVEGPRARQEHHLRGDRRHRRHADARRPLLRRRHPHQLGDHAERAAPDPVHRQHPRRVRQGREDTFLTRSAIARSAIGNPQSRNPQSAIRNPRAWRRNVFAVTAASFMGYTGFTLVMPFLPLFIGQLGVTDVGTDRDVDRPEPRRDARAHGAARARLGTARRSLRPQDHGRAIDGQLRRSCLRRWATSRGRGTSSCCARCRACSRATGRCRWRWPPSRRRATACRRRSAPCRPRSASARRVGPLIGGVLAQARRVAARVPRHRDVLRRRARARARSCTTTARSTRRPRTRVETGRVTFRNVLAFQNFLLMMFVIFGLQFVDRSFGPVLPLWVEQVGVAHARVPLVSGVLFSIMALTGALGHHFCGKLLRHYTSRLVIAGGGVVAAAGCGAAGRDRDHLDHVRRVGALRHRHRRRDDRRLQRGGRA